MPVSTLKNAPPFTSRVPVQFICAANTALSITAANGNLLAVNPTAFVVQPGSKAKVSLGINGTTFFQGDGEYAPFALELEWKILGYTDFQALAALRPYLVTFITWRNIGYYGKLVMDTVTSQAPATADVVNPKGKFYVLAPSDAGAAVTVNRVAPTNYFFDSTLLGSTWTIGANLTVTSGGPNSANVVQYTGTGGASGSGAANQGVSSLMQVIPGNTYSASTWADPSHITAGSALFSIMDPTLVTTFGSIAIPSGANGTFTIAPFVIPANVTQVVGVWNTNGATVTNATTLRFSNPMMVDGSTVPSYVSNGLSVVQNIAAGAGNTGYITPGATNYYWLTFSTIWGESMPLATGLVPTALLSVPTGLNCTGAITGGSLAAATYWYRVSALNAQGETLACAQVSGTVASGSAGSVALAWTAVVGATSYNVYGRTNAGELKLINALTNAYTDTGALTPAGALPVANTAIIGNTSNTINFSWPTSQYVTKCSLYAANTNNPTNANLISELINGESPTWTDLVGFAGATVAQIPAVANNAFRGVWQQGIWANEVP